MEGASSTYLERRWSVRAELGEMVLNPTPPKKL